MRHQPVVILAFGMLLAAMTSEAVLAKPKSFCRRWAAGVANNNLHYEEQARKLEKSGDAADVASIRPRVQDPDDLRPLAGSGLGGALARLGKPARWHDVYRQAYADCRVVQN